MYKLKILIAAAIAASSMVVASSASALSCIQPNFATSFNDYNASEETYWVAYGNLRATGPVVEITPPDYPQDLLPNDPAAINFPKPKVYDAEFKGGFLDGNTVVLNRRYDIKVETTCLGPWCGGFPTSNEPIMFMMKQGQSGMTLEVSPCPGGTHQKPNRRQIEAIQTCLRFGECRTSEEQAFAFN